MDYLRALMRTTSVHTNLPGPRLGSIFGFLSLFVAYVVLIACPIWAHDIITTNLTYSRDISRILSQRCLACHNEQSAVPLVNYEQVRPWAVSIKEQVLARTMPPWGAVKGFGDLSPDGGLSQEEVTLIAAWVLGGAPQGSPTLLSTRVASNHAPTTLQNYDLLTVDTQMRLLHSIAVAGIRPITEKTIESAKITARFPSGQVLPLLWLYRFDPRFHERQSRTFTFREALTLPPGTIVESSTPLHFALVEARSTKPQPLP